jgi:hypothetical protein
MDCETRASKEVPFSGTSPATVLWAKRLFDYNFMKHIYFYLIAFPGITRVIHAPVSAKGYPVDTDSTK